MKPFNLTQICKISEEDFLAVVSLQEDMTESKAVSCRHFGGGIHILTIGEKKFVVSCVEVADNKILGIAQRLSKWIKLLK